MQRNYNVASVVSTNQISVCACCATVPVEGVQCAVDKQLNFTVDVIV